MYSKHGDGEKEKRDRGREEESQMEREIVRQSERDKERERGTVGLGPIYQQDKHTGRQVCKVLTVQRQVYGIHHFQQ